MMIKRFLIALALALSVFGGVAPLAATAATDPFAAVDCNKASDTAVCKTRGNTEDPLTGTNGLIIRATNILAVIAGICAVIFLILGGIKYITSNGDSQQISRAKESVIYALVGIVIIGVARGIIGFVLTKL